MRFVIVALLSACWSSATPPAPPVAGTPTGSCKISDLELMTQEAVTLGVRGKTFARLHERLQRFDVTVVDRAARAFVETELVELEGDLPLDAAPVRPVRAELRDGWLEITRAQIRAAVGGRLRFDVTLPDGFTPRVVSFESRCNEVTFAEPPDAKPDPDGTDYVAIVPGVTAKLRAVIGGPVVASVTGKARQADGEAVEIAVLERRGQHVRVRFARPNAITVWTDASAVGEAGGDIFGGLIGNMVGVSAHRMECARPVPLYVRVGSEAVRVGRLKPNVKFMPEMRRDGMELDLGVEDVKPFVKRADFATCSSSL